MTDPSATPPELQALEDPPPEPPPSPLTVTKIVCFVLGGLLIPAGSSVASNRQYGEWPLGVLMQTLGFLALLAGAGIWIYQARAVLKTSPFNPIKIKCFGLAGLLFMAGIYSSAVVLFGGLLSFLAGVAVWTFQVVSEQQQKKPL